MDVVRKKNPKTKFLRRAIYVSVAVIAVTAVTVGLARLKPANRSVSRGSLLIASVERGTMQREVRGSGTLVPESVRVITATSDGVVERLLAERGGIVRADTILVELVNPELQNAVQEAEWQLRSAEAELARLKVEAQSAVLERQASVARIKSEYQQAKLQADRNAELARSGLVSDVNNRLSAVTAEELENRYKIEEQRLAMSRQAATAQVAARDAEVSQLRAGLALRRSQAEGLRVRAGIDGVLQQLPVEVGQRVTTGAPIARVAEPTRLKAELRVAETQAKDVSVGQKVDLDTHNGVVAGHVVRIDPAVQEGTVLVDVAFDAPLPPGARPDLSVDGVVQIERLENAVYVRRPVGVQIPGEATLFRLEDGDRAASRVRVRLGRASVTTVEVVEGLAPGDRVIVSDTSALDGAERIEIQ